MRNFFEKLSAVIPPSLALERERTIRMHGDVLCLKCKVVVPIDVKTKVCDEQGGLANSGDYIKLPDHGNCTYGSKANLRIRTDKGSDGKITFYTFSLSAEDFEEEQPPIDKVWGNFYQSEDGKFIRF